MERVSVSNLKAHLSHYLRQVRKGGEVQVLDRGTPVAMLTALPPSKVREDDQRLQRLVESGVVRPGSGDARKILEEEPLELGTSILEALKADRADRL